MANIAGPTDEGERVVEVAIAIIQREGTLLVCRRKPDAVLAGLWEFPGGKLEPGESAADCAVREALEELDIHIRADERLTPITHSYPHATIRLNPVLCTHLAGEAKPLGCAEFKWIPPHQLTAHAFPPANAALLRSLLARFA